MKRLVAPLSSLFPKFPTRSVSSVSQSTMATHTTRLRPRDTLPPVPHPCPHDRIALLVTVDGLLLRPHIQGSTRPESHLRIAWAKTVKVECLDGPGEGDGIDWTNAVVVYGIVGVLELFSSSYLMVITSKADVGHLFDTTHAVYCVKGVSAIPLVEDRARVAVNTLAARNAALLRPSLLHHRTGDDVSDLGGIPHHAKDPSARVVQFSDESQSRFGTTSPTQDTEADDAEDKVGISSGTSTPSSDDSVNVATVAKALATRLSFWNNLSKRTRLPSVVAGEHDILTAVEEHEALDAVFKDGKEEPEEVIDSILAETAPTPATSEERHSQLEEKVVRECIREYTKGGMYFAYNFDITRSLQHKQEHFARSQRQHDLLVDLHALDDTEHITQPDQVLAEPYSALPLWRRVDRQFWWNEWLSRPFIDAGLHSYVLPIMQGYYQIASFDVPRDAAAYEESDYVVVDYVVISRRSRDRAGLRYQRRGIDDDAHVANFVETETIMRVEREGVMNVFSYVQIRGSIPLFWTQSGYGLKPPPQLSSDRTHAQNLDIMKRHFQRSVPRHGPHARIVPNTIVNLAEQQGKEGSITHAYREYVEELGSKDVLYREYDFHKETRGMKYENISHLIESLERIFEAQGFYWVSNNSILSRQKGVFRVNCIDCLDRTNVVQSAFARNVLSKQLGTMALLNTEGEGIADTDLVFNDVWANNGDSISRAYAGTSALKGDFTRTGRRDLSGLLHDGVNSIARMYSSTFSDWFCQAVIDFMLGYRNVNVFTEFILKLQSTDPLELIRLSKIRAEAISTSVSRVLTEGERLLSGWTVFAPEQFNVKIGVHFEEKVLLLTVKALYIVRYDYTLEKVKMYTRIPLGDIVNISKGAYILSPLEEASRDPIQNAGFVISWLNSNQITRLTSYSVRNSLSLPSPTMPASPRSLKSKTPTRSQFNALPRNIASLSKILSDASTTGTSATTFAAFKVLPIDPAARRRESSGNGHDDPGQGDAFAAASTCQEEVDLMVDAIRNACKDIGGGQGAFVTETDVVSLAEAQRTTSVYAKMEYGLKRLLWLGG